MSKDPMPLRSIRVPAKLWNAAQTVATERDEVLSEEIRKFIQRYSEGKTK